MSIQIIEDRLKEYAPTSQREEMSALKEIAQEIALYALSRTDFFKQAAFQGGSCLRVAFKLNRFSEDLDFTLMQPNKNFVWEPYLKALEYEFRLYSLAFDAVDRSKADQSVRQMFLKDSSFGKVLVLTHPRGPSDKQSILIKLEIDTNPPAGSKIQTQYLDYPYPFSIVTQDLPSLFSGKCHALLCRPYTKGRDWFDLLWYIAKQVQPNYEYLAHALQQAGPWQGKAVTVTASWLIAELEKRLLTVDWEAARGDAENFVRAGGRISLDAWGTDFFRAALARLAMDL